MIWYWGVLLRGPIVETCQWWGLNRQPFSHTFEFFFICKAPNTQKTARAFFYSLEVPLRTGLVTPGVEYHLLWPLSNWDDCWTFSSIENEWNETLEPGRKWSHYLLMLQLLDQTSTFILNLEDFACSIPPDNKIQVWHVKTCFF